MLSRDEVIRDARELGDGLVSISDEAEASKFHGSDDAEVSAALRIISLNGGCDDEAGQSIDGVWGGRIDNWVLYVDSQGFHNGIEYPSIEDAEVALRQLEPEETDYRLTLTMPYDEPLPDEASIGEIVADALRAKGYGILNVDAERDQ